MAQFLVPLIVDRVLRLAQGHRPVRDGVVLGLLAAWQVLIGEEVLLLTAVGLAVGGVVYLAHGRLPLRRMLPGLGAAAGVCLAIVAVPLWWQFAGPQSYGEIFHPPAGNDLAQLWGRATRSIGADPFASAAVSMNRTEENSFFGVPLLVAAAAVVALLWRGLVQALGAVVVVSCWLSLGEEVMVNGRPTGIPGPWALFEQLPVLGNVLPTRFALVAVPALGALLAIGIEEVRRVTTRYAGHAGAGPPSARRPGCWCCCRSCPPRSSSTSAHRCRRSSATARGATGSTRVARCSRRPRRGSPTPGPWSGRRRRGGAFRWSRGTSSARTPRPNAAASTAPRRPR